MFCFWVKNAVFLAENGTAIPHLLNFKRLNF